MTPDCMFYGPEEVQNDEKERRKDKQEKGEAVFERQKKKNINLHHTGEHDLRVSPFSKIQVECMYNSKTTTKNKK